MSDSDPTEIAGKLSKEIPLVDLGDTGTLMEAWNDPDAVALLRHLCGLPHPETLSGEGAEPEGKEEGTFHWTRDSARPEMLVLDRPLLGIRIAAADPNLLAEGIEYLANCADRLMVAVETDNQQIGGELEIADALALKLRPLLAVTPPDAPLGVTFTPDDTPMVLTTKGHAGEEEAEALRARLREPEVQDHRAVIPPKKTHDDTPGP